MALHRAEILIVDDIPGNLNFVSNILMSEGYGIVASTSGKDAIDIALEKRPDLILLDVAMPGMDGYQVCRALKKNPLTYDIPIIFLTAKVDNEDIIKGFDAGAVDFVSKPFNTNELLSRVNTHIELKNKSQQLKEINQNLEKIVSDRTLQLEESNRNLKEANQNLANAYKKLAQLDKAKNDFIRHINHELRTPLQGIQGFAKIMEEISESAEQKEYIGLINGLVKRLIKLAELSLLFTELKTENYKLELIPVGVAPCLREAVDAVEHSEKGITIKTDKVVNSLYMLADHKLMVACFNIILDNAVKFSPDRSQVIISAIEKGNQIVIDISDSGPGFSAKARKQLFDLFSADNRNEEFQGFGVGLSTAKIILDLLSASLDVVKIPFGGARVRISVPSCTNMVANQLVQDRVG